MACAAAFAAGMLGLSSCGVADPDAEAIAVQTSALSTYDMAVTPLGTVYRPDRNYGSVTMDDILRTASLSARYYSSNRARMAAVHWAANEARRGLCGDPGAEFYGAYYCLWWVICQHDEWCSEFALWVLHQAGIDPNNELRGTDVTLFVTTPAVRDRFAAKALLWQRGDLTPVHQGSGYRYPQAGDYLFMRSSDGDHWGHSGIVVGVSNDSRYVYTVEGNTTGSCVRFKTRDYIVDGVLHDKIDGVGRVQPWAAGTGRFPGHIPAAPILAGAPDPVCSSGILSESGACCPASCGTCGGDGCSGRPGGGPACCIGNILSANVPCATTGPTSGKGCVAADPDCVYGISSGSGACCASSCGTCGGNGCSGRPGGGPACCVGNITTANMSCDETFAPCMVQ
jgi:hypothetical protein